MRRRSRVRPGGIFAIAIIFLVCAIAAWADESLDDALAQAKKQEQAGDFDQAAAIYTQIITALPKNAEAYAARGMVKLQTNDPDGAIADFDQALQINPKLSLAASNRVLAYRAKGNLAAASVAATRALKLDPYDSSLYFARGRVRESSGDLNGAIADYTRALQLNPGNLNGYKGRADASVEKRDWNQALLDFRRCSQTPAPELEDTPIFIWLTRARVGDVKGANRELATDFKDRGTTSFNDWASDVAGYLLGHVTAAEFLTAADSLVPEENRRRHCELFYYLGMKKLIAGDRVAAADNFRKCLASEDRTDLEYELAGWELKALGS